MRMQLRFAWIGMLAMAQLPAVGHAQSSPAPPASSPAPVDPQAQAQAKVYVDKGIEAQDNGQYDVAISYYSGAYQLVPHPMMLFNIAQAHRLAGEIDEAIAMYDRYLQKDPNGSQASTARQQVALLRARKAQSTSKPAPAAPAAAAPQAASREEAHVDELRPASSMSPTIGVPANESPPTPGAQLRLAGMVTGAAGAAALGVAIGFALHAQSLNDEVNKSQIYDPDKDKAGHRADVIQTVGWVTGGALVITGGALYYLGYQKDRHAQSVTLAPVVSSELTGVVLSGTLP